MGDLVALEIGKLSIGVLRCFILAMWVFFKPATNLRSIKKISVLYLCFYVSDVGQMVRRYCRVIIDKRHHHSWNSYQKKTVRTLHDDEYQGDQMGHVLYDVE